MQPWLLQHVCTSYPMATVASGKTASVDHAVLVAFIPLSNANGPISTLCCSSKNTKLSANQTRLKNSVVLSGVVTLQWTSFCQKAQCRHRNSCRCGTAEEARTCCGVWRRSQGSQRSTWRHTVLDWRRKNWGGDWQITFWGARHRDALKILILLMYAATGLVAQVTAAVASGHLRLCQATLAILRIFGALNWPRWGRKRIPAWGVWPNRKRGDVLARTEERN